MKRFYTPCVLFLILSSLLLSAHTQANGVENEPPAPATWMPDANLRNAVRAALRLNANEPLTQEKMLNLQGLNVPKLGIRDLTGLEYAMYLKSLSIGGNQIRNLKPLANLGNLRRLYIGGNRIRHIRHLANLTNLRRLGMLRNQVTDISVLAGLVNLKYLRIEGNPITDTSPLENLPNLSDVDIEIPSLIPDANLREAVRAALGIQPNLRITIGAMRSLTILNAAQLGIADLTGLEYSTNLTHLYIGDNLISNINPLANLTNLRRLEMLRNQVTDISVLAGLVNLEYLRLEGNPITDTFPLRSLPKLIDVDVYISSPPQQENTQPQGESTHFDTDPTQDDGQQKEDRRQDDSGQSQQQQPTTNPQPQQQQQQESPTNLQSPTNPQQPQQQQPPTNPQPQQPVPPTAVEVIPPQPEPEPLQTLPSTQQPEEEEEEEEEERDYEAECKAVGGSWHDGVCVRRPTPQELCKALGGTWDENSETCDGVEGLAPSHPKNVFLLDRITLEQLDPAALEAQLDIWLAESNRSALYLRSIALLESVLATMRPDKTHLLPNYPNPFNPETWIPYHLANPSDVQITIYDTRGTVVRHLDLGHQQAGYYTSRSRAVYWDGCNDIGEKVSSGIYFYQLQTDKTSQLRKMVILK